MAYEVGFLAFWLPNSSPSPGFMVSCSNFDFRAGSQWTRLRRAWFGEIRNPATPNILGTAGVSPASNDAYSPESELPMNSPDRRRNIINVVFRVRHPNGNHHEPMDQCFGSREIFRAISA